MKKHIIYNSEVSREDALESIAFNLDEGERIEDVSDERIWEEQAFLSELY